MLLDQQQSKETLNKNVVFKISHHYHNLQRLYNEHVLTMLDCIHKTCLFVHKDRHTKIRSNKTLSSIFRKSWSHSWISSLNIVRSSSPSITGGGGGSSQWCVHQSISFSTHGSLTFGNGMISLSTSTVSSFPIPRSVNKQNFSQTKNQICMQNFCSNQEMGLSQATKIIASLPVHSAISNISM